MGSWDKLAEDFTPCDRCGWPLDDEAETVTAGDGTTKVMHSFCVPRRIRLRTEHEHRSGRPT